MNMYIRNKLFGYIVGIFLLVFPQMAFAADCFTSCRVEKEHLRWGEACRISLSVYTSTWFTDGVAFPEMTGQNGVLLKQDRSHASSEIVGGKRYSVITQEYLYYPFGIGKQHIHFNDIEVMLPSVGEYSGTRQKLSFPQKDIEVSGKHPYASKRTTAVKLKVKQHFDMPDTLRVGDIVMRSIEYTASGVPAAFIVMPELRDTLGFAHIIQEQPSYITRQEEGQVSGHATQKILYQLTDSGDFTLPSLQINYNSLKNGQINSIILESKIVHVLPALHSQTSITQQTAQSCKGDKKQTTLFYGICIILLLLILSILVIRGKRHIVRSIYWKILTVPNVIGLYELLYVHARSLSYSNFTELANRSQKLRRWYAKFICALFKDEYRGKVTLQGKANLLYIIFCTRR